MLLAAPRLHPAEIPWDRSPLGLQAMPGPSPHTLLPPAGLSPVPLAPRDGSGAAGHHELLSLFPSSPLLFLSPIPVCLASSPGLSGLCATLSIIYELQSGEMKPHCQGGPSRPAGFQRATRMSAWGRGRQQRPGRVARSGAVLHSPSSPECVLWLLGRCCRIPTLHHAHVLPQTLCDPSRPTPPAPSRGQILLPPWGPAPEHRRQELGVVRRGTREKRSPKAAA